MSIFLEWNTLQEAANYLTEETGETWTQRQVLEAGEKELFKVCFIRGPDAKAWTGRTTQWVGDSPELWPAYIDALLKNESVFVGYVPFTNAKGEAVAELKPRASVTFNEIRIRRSELDASVLSKRSAPAQEVSDTVADPIVAKNKPPVVTVKKKRVIKG